MVVEGEDDRPISVPDQQRAMELCVALNETRGYPPELVRDIVFRSAWGQEEEDA